MAKSGAVAHITFVQTAEGMAPKKDARAIETVRASDEDLCVPERKSSSGSHGAD